MYISLVVVILIVVGWFVLFNKDKDAGDNNKVSWKNHFSIRIIDKVNNKDIDNLNSIKTSKELKFDLTKDMEYINSYVKVSGCVIDFDGDWKNDYSSESGCNPSFTYTKSWKYQPKWYYQSVDGITQKEKEVEIRFPEITVID